MSTYTVNIRGLYKTPVQVETRATTTLEFLGDVIKAYNNIGVELKIDEISIIVNGKSITCDKDEILDIRMICSSTCLWLIKKLK